MLQKQLFSLGICLSIIFNNSAVLFQQAHANYEPFQKTFVVTAYYSPLPGQEYYVTGSLASDKRLNGNGTNGADGTPVYHGLIAAPSSYAFGTRINCPGIIDGEIHDRGGAIVKAGIRSNAFDRLDFWAGYGDEGLKKALFWGKRTLTCTMSPPGYSGEFEQYINLPLGSLGSLASRFLNKTKKITYNTNYIAPRYSNLLSDLGYDPNDQDSRAAFQIRHQIIANGNDSSAGIIGPMTRTRLEAIYIDIANNTPRENLEEGNISSDVRLLQQVLVNLSYLKVKSTAIFGPQTKAALIKFQLEQNLISNKNHPAAGYLGPETHLAFKQLALKKYKISSEDQDQIALLKADETEALFIAKANELAKQTPTETTEETQETDPFDKALHELSKEWIKEHSAPSQEPESQEAKIILASFHNDESFQQVKAKLSPIYTPFQKHLYLGMKHSDIQKLQKLLSDNGYLTRDTLTDYFGIETKKAVRQFQIDYGIVASIYSAGAGAVGPKTIKALNALNFKQEFSLPREITNVIRAPAVHPNDLRISAPTQHASLETKEVEI